MNGRLNMRVRAAAATLGLVLACGAWTAAHAQTSTGAIRGFVRDAEGQPLVGAVVLATQPETNFQRSALTTQSGFFNLPGLQPGPYTVEVSMVGYRDRTQDVRLQIGQTLSLELTMTEQAIALEAIQVAAGRIVETRTPEVATNISREQIENVPINDRNFLSLALLVPGVRSDGGSITASGQSANNINVFLDGISFKNDMLVGGVVGQDASQGNPFPQAAIQEFRVITQQYKAEYQKATSAIITATTKSGTNEWTGEVFAFGQNNSLVRQDYFTLKRCADSRAADPNFVCTEQPKRDKLQGGLSVGGPILRDRLFFFGTYEGNHVNRGNTTTLPLLNDLRSVNPTLANQIAPIEGTFNGPVRSNLYFGKLTYVPSVGSAHRFEISTSIRDEYDLRDFGGVTAREAAVHLQNDVNTYAFKHQYAKSAWLNELSVSFQNYQWHPRPAGDTPFSQEINYNGQRVANIGSRCCVQDWVQDRLSFRNDLTYTLPGVMGDHVFKVGGNLDFLKYDITQTNNIRPTQRWNNVQNDYAFPYEIVAGFGTPGAVINNEQIGLYIQDDWTVTPRLALNLGLRWDYETNEANNNHVTAPGDLTALQAYVATLPCGEQSSDHVVRARQLLCDLDRYTTDGSDRKAFTGAFQPRIGFSYDLFGTQRTVLFGGFGVYYDRNRVGNFIGEIQRGRFEQYTFRFSTDGAPVGNNPTIIWDDSYLTREGLATILEDATRAPGGELHLYANDTKPPHTNQYSLGVRQAFGQDYMLTANYAGARGYDFLVMMRANRNPNGSCCQQNNPIWSNLFVGRDVGRTWYDALMLKGERRYREDSRWGVQIAYTLARSEQNVNPGDRFSALNQFIPETLTRYPANNDERHHLTTNWMIGLPWEVRFSGLIDLGSGTPFNSTLGFGPGTNSCTHGNQTCEGGHDFPPGKERNWYRPPLHSFIIPNAWAFRNVDLRLEKRFPTMRGQQVGVIAEVFNVFDYANFNGYNTNWGRYEVVDGEVQIVRNRDADGNLTFGTPTSVVTDVRRFGAPRRFQLGLRYQF